MSGQTYSTTVSFENGLIQVKMKQRKKASFFFFLHQRKLLSANYPNMNYWVHKTPHVTKWHVHLLQLWFSQLEHSPQISEQQHCSSKTKFTVFPTHGDTWVTSSNNMHAYLNTLQKMNQILLIIIIIPLQFTIYNHKSEKSIL